MASNLDLVDSNMNISEEEEEIDWAEVMREVNERQIDEGVDLLNPTMTDIEWINAIEKKTNELNKLKKSWDQIVDHCKQLGAVLQFNGLKDWEKIIDFTHLKGVISRQNLVKQMNKEYYFVGSGPDLEILNFFEQIYDFQINRIKLISERLPENKSLVNYLKNWINSLIDNKCRLIIEENIDENLKLTDVKREVEFPSNIEEKILYSSSDEIKKVFSKDCYPKIECKCGGKSPFLCIAFCKNADKLSVEQSVVYSKKTKTHYDHYALYSVKEGKAIQGYNLNGSPIDTVCKAIEIPSNAVMSVDIEFFPDITGELLAARIAIVCEYVGTDPTNVRHNSLELVFHAMVRMEDENFWNFQTQNNTHINPYEHSDKQKFLKTSPKEDVVKSLSKYLDNHIILFKNYKSDLSALINIGYTFDPKTVRFYDIEKFFLRYLPQNRNKMAIGLKWIKENLLLIPNQDSKVNTIHSPIVDARHHLMAAKRILFVLSEEQKDEQKLCLSNFISNLILLNEYELNQWLNSNSNSRQKRENKRKVGKGPEIYIRYQEYLKLNVDRTNYSFENYLKTFNKNKKKNKSFVQYFKG